MALSYTNKDDILATYNRVSQTFRAGTTLPLAYRRRQLLQLARMFQDNKDAIYNALQADISRHKVELNIVTMVPIIGGALRAAESLEEWNKPEKVQVEEWRKNYDTTVYRRPKGVVLIIGPWNYPMVTTMLPLIGAIAAGNTAVYKPSELSPASAKVLTDLFPKYLDPNAFAIVNGAVPETTTLLDLKWNHIFFTGSKRVGQIVAKAAAKYVTPLTLELGSKSPVFVDGSTADLDLAARRILWGKQLTAGQICVSPDYVLVERKYQDALVEAFVKSYNAFFPNGPFNSSYASIVNPTHFKSLITLLDKTRAEKVIGGGIKDTNFIEPTIYKNVGLDDALMEDEIFGPLLAIVPVDNVEQAIQVINDHPVPLVIYLFTNDDSLKEKFLDCTQSGTLCQNDTVQQLGVYEMPFGGQGESGYGSYLGKHSFDAFVQLRSYINVPPSADQFVGLRFPPYSDQAADLIGGPTNAPIPAE